MCITADTEILTKDDWKGYSSVSTRDKVATFNPISGNIEYQAPIELVWKENYSGELIHIQNENTNQLLTTDHRVLVKKRFTKGTRPNQTYHWDSTWSFELTKTLLKVVKTKGKLQLPLAGKYKAGTLSIGKVYAELLGWILMDGWFDKNCRGIRITQSSANSKKVKRIRFILEQLNVKYTERTKKYKVITNPSQININHIFYLNASDFTDRIRRDIPDKKPTWDLLQLRPSELVAKKAPCLFTGLLGGDSGLYGKKNKKKDRTIKNSCALTQKDPNTRAWFQALCSLVGCRSKDSPDAKKTPRVTICGRDTTQIKKHHVTIKRTRNPLRIWGVETPNKSVVCRRTTIEENRAGEKVRKSYVFITGAN